MLGNFTFVVQFAIFASDPIEKEGNKKIVFSFNNFRYDNFFLRNFLRNYWNFGRKSRANCGSSRYGAYMED